MTGTMRLPGFTPVSADNQKHHLAIPRAWQSVPWQWVPWTVVFGFFQADEGDGLALCRCVPDRHMEQHGISLEGQQGGRNAW